MKTNTGKRNFFLDGFLFNHWYAYLSLVYSDRLSIALI
jgi:hypothetical protein